VWLVMRWPLFGAAVIAALALGYFGFRLYFEDQQGGRGATDLWYLSLQLFVLESGSVPETGAPWQLEVARLLAPVTTAAAIVVALVAVFREELEEVRLRLRRGHVVVCGLGERGSRLVLSLLAAGYRVVAIEIDPANQAILEMRGRGALVVVGDARMGEVLRRAHIQHVAHVVALAGADGTNAEVAIRAGDLASARGPALTCLAHVRDPGLCALLRSEELAAGHATNYRLDFFNIYEQGARALLHDNPPFRDTTDEPHLAVIGLTPLGQAVIIEAARKWRVHPDARERRMQLTVFDPEAEGVIDLLKARYPQLDHVADVRSVETGFDHLDVSTVGSAKPWQAIYVCVDDDSSALDTALQARRSLADLSTPIVVELGRSAGLAELLERPAGYEGLHPFDLFDRTLQPELLLGGTYEILSRVIHAEYVDEQRRQGATAATVPSLVPWDRLPDSLKESNRDQAAHIGVKLAAIGCGIAPLCDWDADQFTFTQDEVERLAEMEHDRWTKQRLRDDWKLGTKDIDAKVSPYLVPWGQLIDDVKEWDRRAVRGIPGFLARAGYQVERGIDLQATSASGHS
jgi:voltage-gated potassium channel Kch